MSKTKNNFKIRKNAKNYRKVKTVKKGRTLIFTLIFALILGSIPFIQKNNSNVSAVENEAYCTSAACRTAKKAEIEAAEKANQAAKAAVTLEGEVERMQQEIIVYEARIKSNEAEASDLKIKIEDTTKKLKLQRAALANMLVNIHLEGETDAIMVLASSSSLSDFAEKKSRIDTAKDQVNSSAQNVKTMKDDLEKQKTEIDRIILDQQIQRKAIEDKKAEQQELILKYKDNAASFAAEAAASREEKIKLINKEYQEYLSRASTSAGFGTKADGFNSYGAFVGNYGYSCPRDNIAGVLDSYYICQCTSYAAYKAVEYYGRNIRITGWGNAYSWAAAARARGYRVDRVPAAHTIAQTTSGQFGHVAWVESVNADGTITVSEYNNPYSSKSGQWGDFGVRTKVSPNQFTNYIHFD